MTESKLIIFNQEFDRNINSQELIGTIEDKLLETLWMELALFDILQFHFFGYLENARGSIFSPIGFDEAMEENIEEYFNSFDRRYLEWVDLEFKIDVKNFTNPDISEEGEEFYDLNRFEKILVFCLKYGEQNEFLNLTDKFDENEILTEYGMGYDSEWGCNGIKTKVTPNKEKIEKLLKDRNHTFGNLSTSDKIKIIVSLLDTKRNPHKGPTGRDFPYISEHLLELIKMHPQTSDELKVIISLPS